MAIGTLALCYDNHKVFTGAALRFWTALNKCTLLAWPLSPTLRLQHAMLAVMLGAEALQAHAGS